MGFLRLLGFALIVVLTIAGLDYHQLSKRADQTLTVQGYLATIQDRLGAYQTAFQQGTRERDRKKQWRQGSKPYLPDAGSGWAMAELTDTQNDTVAAVLAEYGPTPIISSISNPAELTQLASAGPEGIARKLAETGRVYSKHSEIAWLDISLKPEAARNTLAALALSRQQNFMTQSAGKQGFAVIDGVAFMEITQDSLDPTGKFKHRRIEGRIGFDQEVVFRINTNASDTSIIELLSMIDYGALNALLTVPSRVVGAGHVVAPVDQVALAQEMDRLYSEMVSLQEQTSDQKLENLDFGAVIVNAMTSAGFNSEGVMDITGGKVSDDRHALQLGYVRAQELLFQTGVQQAAAGDAAGGVDILQDAGGALPAAVVTEGGTNATGDAPASLPVRVHKGGLGSGCAQTGSLKRCSAGGQ